MSYKFDINGFIIRDEKKNAQRISLLFQFSNIEHQTQ